jgi:hypothetical protein
MDYLLRLSEEGVSTVNSLSQINPLWYMIVSTSETRVSVIHFFSLLIIY